MITGWDTSAGVLGALVVHKYIGKQPTAQDLAATLSSASAKPRQFLARPRILTAAAMVDATAADRFARKNVSKEAAAEIPRRPPNAPTTARRSPARAGAARKHALSNAPHLQRMARVLLKLSAAAPTEVLQKRNARI